MSAKSPLRAAMRVVACALALGLAAERPAGAEEASPGSPSDDDLRIYAVHVNRTPPQSWPGYGMYLGNGLVITAYHVPGRFAETRPRVVIGGLNRPTSLVKEGSFDGVDLTLLSVDASTLPVRMRMRRLPLCDKGPFPGEGVVVVTPESSVRSRVLPPSEFRASCRIASTLSSATSPRPGTPVRGSWTLENRVFWASSAER